MVSALLTHLLQLPLVPYTAFTHRRPFVTLLVELAILFMGYMHRTQAHPDHSGLPSLLDLVELCTTYILDTSPVRVIRLLQAS
jgi:hypothetical protein